MWGSNGGNGIGLRNATRGVSPVIGAIVLLAIVVVIAAVAGAGFVSLGGELPEETPPSSAFDLDVDRDNGTMEFVPTYMRGDTELQLRINGKTAYEWTGDNATESRTVTCLKRGDSVRIVNTNGDREHTAFEQTLDAPLRCNLDGIGKQFAYAKVGDREVPINEQNFKFDLSINLHQNGNTVVPASNPWNVVYRYDRTVEGLDEPVYIVVFADNVDFSDTPTQNLQEETLDAFSVDEGGNVDIEPHPNGVEPTEDVWVAFKPGCDQSKFMYLGEETAGDHSVMLNGATMIPSTDSTPTGTIYTADGVDCV